MRNAVKRIMDGRGEERDLGILRDLGAVMKAANKCGLGQTAGNPALTTIENFPEIYDAKLAKDDRFNPGFDLASAVVDSCNYVGRTPNL